MISKVQILICVCLLAIYQEFHIWDVLLAKPTGEQKKNRSSQNSRRTVAETLRVSNFNSYVFEKNNYSYIIDRYEV